MRVANLFSQGFWGRNGASLDDVLRNHERQVLNEIASVVRLDELTDEFVKNLVDKSLVQPVVLQPMTKNITTENISAEMFPEHFGARMVGGSFPEQVAHITVPFTGDPALLRCCPSQFSCNLPIGDIVGNKITWSVILFKYADGGVGQVRSQTEGNYKFIETMLANANKQVMEFNERLPKIVGEAFEKKLKTLTEQLAIFDDLGIPDTPEEKTPTHYSTPIQKRAKRNRPEVIMQLVHNQFEVTYNQYVQQLNQSNNNSGDVNNAIQPAE